MRDETQRVTGMPVTPEVAALLAAAQRAGEAGLVAEKRALDAFRAARDEGAHAPVSPLRRRRRDDWRPVERWRGVRSVRAVLAGLTAAVALGGVAVAAGSGAMPGPFGAGGHDRPRPSPPRTVSPPRPAAVRGAHRRRVRTVRSKGPRTPRPPGLRPATPARHRTIRRSAVRTGRCRTAGRPRTRRPSTGWRRRPVARRPCRTTATASSLLSRRRGTGPARGRRRNRPRRSRKRLRERGTTAGATPTRAESGTVGADAGHRGVLCAPGPTAGHCTPCDTPPRRLRTRQLIGDAAPASRHRSRTPRQ